MGAQGRQMGRVSLAFLSETRAGSVSLRADCVLFYSQSWAGELCVFVHLLTQRCDGP